MREIFQKHPKLSSIWVSCNMSEILIVTALGCWCLLLLLIPCKYPFSWPSHMMYVPSLALGLVQGDVTVMQANALPEGFKENIISNRDWGRYPQPYAINPYPVCVSAGCILSINIPHWRWDWFYNNIAFNHLDICAALMYSICFASYKLNCKRN